MEGIQPPSAFLPVAGKPKVPWSVWYADFEVYALAVGWSEWAEERQQALLLHCVGPEARRLYRTKLPAGGIVKQPKLEGDDSAQHRTLAMQSCSVFEELFASKRDFITERVLFRRCVQDESTSVQTYLANLREKSQRCGFGHLEEEMIRDQFLEGCVSNRLRERLCAEQNLTLARLEELAAAADLTAERHVTVCSRSSREGAEGVFQEVAATSGRINPTRSQGSTQQVRTCFSCGFGGHRSGDSRCPARGRTCFNCNEVGHFAKVCNSKKRRQYESGRNASHVSTVEVSAVCDLSDVSSPMLEVEVEGEQLEMMVDTGSPVSMLPVKLYNAKLSHIPMHTCDVALKGYGGHMLDVMGVIHASVVNEGKKTSAKLYVMNGGTVPLLGRDLQCSLQISVKHGNVVCAVLPESISGLPPLRGFVHRVNVKDDVFPVQQKMRPLPYSVREEVKAHLADLEEKGIIERVDASPWISPLVVTRRRTGGIRVCLDLKQVNRAVIPSKYPIPDMSDMLDKLKGAVVFSSLDMKSAFNQLPLHEESRNLTAFMTPDGLWRYTRCCFGLSSIPAAFQKVMDKILSGLPGVQVYLDDIIVFGESQNQHDIHLQQVMARLEEHQVTLNREKCTFSATSLEFLGFTITRNGFKVSEDRVRGMKDMQSPKTAKQLQSALGLFGFYARFVDRFSTLVDPLRAALKIERFLWTAELETCFREVISRIVNSSALTMYDPELQTVVTSDASDVGLGAVLSQIHPDGERVIAFASATLSPAQRRYSVTEREALAVKWSVEHWHKYLFGTRFTLRTDHQALQSLLSSKGIGRAGMRMSRWAVRLMAYSFNVEHVRGPSNVADGLSRLPASTQAPAEDEQLMVAAITDRVTRKSAVTRDDIRSACAIDAVLIALCEQIERGWTARSKDCPADLLPFYRARHELTVADGLVFRGERIVVPSSLRAHLLEQAHESHPGIVRTKQRLRELFWWPGMDVSAEKMVKSCDVCDAADKSAKTRHIHLQPVPFPEKPWSKLGIDFIGPLEGGGPGRSYAIVMTDYYSKWPEVAFCSHPSSRAVIDFMETIAAREGYPEELVSDNGTAFTSREFTEYLKEVGVKHIRVTPYHPRGAGAVERFNRVLKGALQVASFQGQDWVLAVRQFLLQYRTTPHATTGQSPAELLRGRQLRTPLRAAADDHHQMVTDNKVRTKVEGQQAKQKSYWDSKYSARENTFKVGDCVRYRLMPRPRKGRPRFSKPLMIVQARGGHSFKLSDDTLVHGERLVRANPENVTPLTGADKAGGDWSSDSVLLATGGAPAGGRDTGSAVAEETLETWPVVELDLLPGPESAGPLVGDDAGLAPGSTGLLEADEAQEVAPPLASAPTLEGGEVPVAAGLPDCTGGPGDVSGLPRQGDGGGLQTRGIGIRHSSRQRKATKRYIEECE